MLLERALRQVGAVQLFDRRRDLGPRAREVALPLGDIELVVRLEGWILEHLPQDPRRRPVPRRVDDLLIRNRDAEAAIGALEQPLLDDLGGQLPLELLPVLP